MRGLAPQEDDFACGIHVLMYIDGFERRDIYGYDKEIVFSYWQKTAIDLICNKENRVRPNVQCALEIVQGDAALGSVQGEAALAVVIAPQQQESSSMAEVTTVGSALEKCTKGCSTARIHSRILLWGRRYFAQEGG